MRGFLTLLIISAVSTAARAQMSSTPVGGAYRSPFRQEQRSPEPKKRTRSPSSYNTSRSENSGPVDYSSAFFISTYYSTADEGSYKGTATVLGQSMPYTATEDTTSAPGLAFGYLRRPANGFGLNGFLAYEFPRKGKSLSGQANGYKITGTYQGNVSTSLLSSVVNGIWSYNTWLYFYAGANYPLIMGTPDYAKLSGLPGYQIGVGSSLTERFGVHLEYRVIRMKGQLNFPNLPLTIDEARLPGFILSVDYSI